MDLKNTKQLMKTFRTENTFGDYAVLVGKGKETCLITSPGVDGNTYFDVASMTKVLATSTLALQAIGAEKIHTEDTLSAFFENVPDDKKDITVKQLLTHSSGILRTLLPDGMTDHHNITDFILSAPLGFAPGTDYTYSCHGTVLLAFILEKVYGMPLDVLYQNQIARPLGLQRSRFNIGMEEENAVISYRWKERHTYRVDDENAYTMQGVAGNAGLFTCANDIKILIEAILGKDARLYPKELFAIAETDYTPHFSEGRGLGYAMVDERYTQTADLFPKGSFGHCGHSGTSFFINREQNLYAIVLTNATRYANMKTGFCGYDYGTVMQMRARIHHAIKTDL